MKIAIVGYGLMGHILQNVIIEDKIVGIISSEFNNHLDDLKEVPDVIIDFSNRTNLEMILEYTMKHNIGCLIATTGYTENDLEKIEMYKTKCRIMLCPNFSLGILVMKKIVKEVSKQIGKLCDVEIIEKHHNKKIDVPSGTANMLYSIINEELNYKKIVGRNKHGLRSNKEIGISSIRGKNLCGEHEVLFMLEDETLSIKHETFSKEVFAKKALICSKWLIEQKNGLYTIENYMEKGENYEKV